MVRFWVALLVFLGGVLLSSSYAMSPQEEKLLFQTLGEIKSELKQLNKRIDGVNKRIDDLSRRIDDTNRRIDDLRQEMNARFEQVDRRFEQVDKRFEQIDKHFEEVNDRINNLVKIFGWIVGGLFALSGTFVGLLVWDRRSTIKAASSEIKKEVMEEIEVEKLKALLGALREIAKKDKELEKVLKNYGLL